MPADIPALDRLATALPTLRLDQLTAMGERVTADHALRLRVIPRVAGPALAARWRAWAPVFGLPAATADAPAVEALAAPYIAVGRPHRSLAPYLHGVLAVLDAALATNLCPTDAAAVVLGGPWADVVPAVEADAEFGPRTADVRAVLVAVPGAAPTGGPAWAAACRAAEDAAAAAGTPFLARHLWAAAHRAAGPDAARAAAIWGAAVAAALGPALPAAARDALAARTREARTLAA